MMSLLGAAICLFKRTHLLKRRKATPAEIYRFMPLTGYPVKMVRVCGRCGHVEPVVARRGKVKGPLLTPLDLMKMDCDEMRAEAVVTDMMRGSVNMDKQENQQ